MAPVSIILLTGFTINEKQKAYLGDQIIVEQSPYVGVSKTASKTSFTNEELPQDVTFTITVTAKQGKLTSVRVNDSIVVSGNTSATLPGKSWDIPEVTTSWTDNFSVALPGTVRDSLVANTVTVTADVENQPSQTTSASVYLVVGNPPQDCPTIWPTTRGFISQGPGGTETHKPPDPTEAIDIHGNPVGTDVVATHKGTVQIKDDGYGKRTLVHGFCNGKAFSSMYAHLSEFPSGLRNGQEVNRGFVIGYVGCTGICKLPHVHYQFNGLVMEPPFIPRSVPRGCVGNCNVTLP